MRNKANHGGAGRALALLSAVVLLLGVNGGSLAAGADDDPTPVVTTTADPEPTTISTDGPADTDPSDPPTSDDPDDAVGEKPADNAPSTPADDTNPVDSDEPGPDKKDEAEDGSDTSTPDPNASTPEDDEDAGTTNTNDDAPGAGGDQSEQPKAGKPAGGGVSTFAAAASPFALPIGALNPTELYNENFENNTDQLYPPKMLNHYTGAGAHEYAASTYWLDKGYCNGFVTSFNVPVSQALINSTYCGKNGSGFDEGDYWAVRAKALVLGGLPGGPSAAGNNHALSMNSSGGLPSTDLNNAGSIMFQTKPATPIQINLPAGSSDGRFIAFSVDAANTQCLTDGQAFRNPKMRFQYVHNGTTADLPLGAGTYIDPCSTAGSTAFDVSSNFPGSEIGSSRQTLWNNNKGWIASGKYGTFYSGSFFLQNSSPIGLILRNVSEASSEGAGIGNPNGTQTHVKGRYNGNDGAIDNIRIVDVTPVLDKEFSPAVQSVGQTSTMTLTIYNRTDKGEKKGWEFTDTLPAGLEFVNNTVTNTCASPTSAVVNVANRTLTVTNGLLRNGDVSCTITAKVTSTSAVTYTNGKPNGNFSNVKGIDGPPNAEVAFWSGSVSWSKVDDQTPSNLLAGSVWTLSGPSPATTSAPAGGWPVGEVTDCTAWPCTGLLDQNPATGQFKVTGLPAGTYTLTEKTAPQGYELITGSFTATVSDASRDVVFTGTGVADGKIKNTRKLGMAAWEKIDDQTPAANLGGSEWTVQGPYTGSTPSGTTTSVVDCVGTNQPSQEACNVDKDSAAGKFRLENLAWGSYTVTETKAPAGHQLTNPAQAFTFTVDAANAGTVINGGKVVNPRIPGEVTWAKVETGTTTKLSGSEWKLEGPAAFNGGSPQTVVDCVGANLPTPAACNVDLDPVGGAFKLVGLPWGNYTLTETKAPAGYVLSSASIEFTVGIDSPAKLVWNHGDIENDRREGPAIPFTGGLGRDAFFIAGGAVLFLGLAAAGVSGARRRRAR